jgi:hypothetical protein
MKPNRTMLPPEDGYLQPCPFRKSYPDVLVVQSSQDGNGGNGARSYFGKDRICPAPLQVRLGTGLFAAPRVIGRRLVRVYHSAFCASLFELLGRDHAVLIAIGGHEGGDNPASFQDIGSPLGDALAQTALHWASSSG